MQRADYGQALKAARRWIAEHGRYPQQQEWEPGQLLGQWSALCDPIPEA
jgi:hypothetical protein